ncbi:MAG: hypothetical protein Kow00109_01770 [Acidobacteriota bacterium]
MERISDPASPRILLVEDDVTLLSLMRAVLSGAGYQVDEVLSAEEAQQRVEKDGHRYDLAVTDLHLGEDTCLALIEQLKSVNSRARILVTTGGDDEGSPHGCPVLQKPFRPGELLRAVQELLAEPR